MKLIRLIRITAGGHHAWYETDIVIGGIPMIVKKPIIPDLPVTMPVVTEQTDVPKPQRSIWQRFIDWIKRIVGLEKVDSHSNDNERT